MHGSAPERGEKGLHWWLTDEMASGAFRSGVTNAAKSQVRAPGNAGGEPQSKLFRSAPYHSRMGITSGPSAARFVSR
jgi:hypothetical protein